MTFDEYTKQDTPTLQPTGSVIIEQSNLKYYTNDKVGVIFPNRKILKNVLHYIVDENTLVLWTSDLESNKSQRSCFKLSEDVKHFID